MDYGTHEQSQSAKSSDKRRKRAALLISAPSPRRSSSLQRSSSPVSVHPPTTPCLHFPFRLTPHVGSGAREPDCRAHAPARCSHPPSQLTPYPAGQAPFRAGERSALSPILSVVVLPLLSRADRATSKDRCTYYMNRSGSPTYAASETSVTHARRCSGMCITTNRVQYFMEKL